MQNRLPWKDTRILKRHQPIVFLMKSHWVGKAPCLDRGLRGSFRSDLRDRNPYGKGIWMTGRVDNWNFWCERAMGPGSAQENPECLERMAEGVIDGGSLKSTVGHAVITLWVPSDSIAIPLGILEKSLERGGIPLPHQEVTGSLPTENIVGRVAPRGALVGLVACQKVQKQAGLVENPAAFTFPPQPKNFAKELLALLTRHEDFLVGRPLITIARGNRDAFHPKLHRTIEEICDFLRTLTLEQG